MTSYVEFSADLLRALYQFHKDSGPSSYLDVADLLERANLENDKFFVPRFLEQWDNYYINVRKHLGPYVQWHVRMLPAGFSHVEDEILTLDEEIIESVELGDIVEAEVVPASDRMVRLDHNDPVYVEIATGLGELEEEIRKSNDLPCDSDERERLLRSLIAAQKLWEAAQLKVIQIKIGIILTVEDAVAVLVKVGKAVGKELLVDAIKAFIKNKTGIEL